MTKGNTIRILDNFVHRSTTARKGDLRGVLESTTQFRAPAGTLGQCTKSNVQERLPWHRGGHRGAVFKVGQEVTVIAEGRSAMFRNYHQARNLFNSTGLLQDKLFRFADVGFHLSAGVFVQMFQQ